MELELRSSDFAAFASKGLLESLLLEVSFDYDNLVDLKFSRDISQDSQFELVNISADKRSLKQSEIFFVNDMTEDSSYRFPLYSLNDVLQLRIRDF